MPTSLLIVFLVLMLAAMALGFAGHIFWVRFTGADGTPRTWKEALASGEVSETLRILETDYIDKVRFFNLWLQLERIRQEQIPGDLAELGVYKGETARLLRHAIPGRRLHLFDTFSGFAPEDLSQEAGEPATYTPRHFSDTSPELVLRTIGTDQNIEIHKGYFPDTAVGMEDTFFAFVHIDADLYQPTRAGLAFFYPRLSPGGVIIIHDHNRLWPGVMQAVREFQSQIPESFIQIPDKDSSVMLVKLR
ncbi:MAG TPA: TylF/MycF/NovP-related O-methyltransferase [Bacteroidales bacterium]|nr:class I SAM-dependent methyltransferase [Lentimicrobiaceae bacterium]HOI00462.1 TylF/MycF/NovP-related O-methyltransferase [Bacteroidales bacterium]